MDYTEKQSLELHLQIFADGDMRNKERVGRWSGLQVNYKYNLE